jgi:biopolymer transport protein TolR
MRRSLQKHQLRLISEISVTPLLDVVLVLLLVFMVAAPLLKQGGKIDLPTAAVRSETPKHVVTLTLDQTAAMTLDGRAVDSASLAANLQELVATDPGIGVLVQTDRNLPVQSLVDVMEALRGSGVTRTSVATRPAP